MLRRTSICAASAALASMSISFAAVEAHAQSTDLATTELPPIVVEGATVEKPKIAVRRAAGKDVVVGVPPSNSDAPPVAVDGGEGGAGASATETISGVPADQIGSSVTVISAAQLKAQEIRYVADALRSQPGVSVSRTGSPGSLTQVRIRGAEGNQTLVLIDGIDASDTANGEFDFSNLLVDDIDRIEIIRGGQSGIGGSKAIGGVINVITKNGKGPLTVVARAEGGSMGTREAFARVSAGNDKVWFSLSGGSREVDGFDISPVGHENDPTRISTLNVRGGAQLLKGVTLDFTLHHIDKNLKYDDFGYAPGQPYLMAIDGNFHNKTSIWLSGANLTWDSFDGAFTQVLRATRNTTSSHDGGDYGPSTNESEANKFGYLATYRFGARDFRNSVTGMAQYEDEAFTPISLYTDGLERKRDRMAYVGEYRGEYFDRLFPTVSVRHDDNDSFADYTTWHAAVSLRLPEIGARPHASVGTAVTLPGMYEQFGSILGQFQGNPNLLPEESFGWDAGVEFTTWNGRAVLDVTYFNANLTNEITGIRVGGIYTPINLNGESERQGVEISGRAMLTPDLSVGMSYTRLLAYEPNGLTEIRRPRNAGRADLNYSFNDKRGNLNLAAIYNGTTIDNAYMPDYTPVRVSLDSYWLVNATASYKLMPGVESYVRVENLLNENYQEVYGYATPGVAAYAGMRFTFEELQSKAWAEGR
ncbi:hypothetical protein DLM45_04320 [Hyphomicrobium methylovorum]|uniref:TonB-dependent receptor plug domain-containing protein n=1 Tax=Hyphomicrobium methylovorum TaxID=84 RepID=UPI0015E76B83|nr:TonB-dependent receptor [Hyphomicrobium methylovorum]MBA2125449.1 hypothetical protein [Hyphomicrobium methylovorum]